MEALHKIQCWNKIKFSADAPVAVTAGQDEVPDPVYVARQKRSLDVREYMDYIGEIARAWGNPNLGEAVEAVSFLVAVQCVTR